MEFEVLKRSRLKRNIIIGIAVVAIISAVILNFTRAKYRTAQSMPLYNATVNYTPYDFKMVAMYQESDTGEYVSIDTVPTSGYTLNKESSYCEVGDTKDDSIVMKYENGIVNIGVSKKGTKCYLYFDVYVPLAKDTLLTYYPTVLTRTDFSTTVTNTTTGVIYKSADESQYDEDGEVYYFAGNPTDNWVSFAGYYWRIIRINGDNTVRLIYNGTNTTTTGTGTQISTSGFNSSSGDNMYVGYMYTSGEVHGLGTSSTIKGVLDTWYSNNLSSYASYIDTNAGFCGDRSISPTSSGTGTGTTTTFYGASYRLYAENSASNASPSFRCINSSDLYTVSSSNKGNNALTYPIGLITADEVAYAGGVHGTNNSSYYLYTNQQYWAMTPYGFASGNNYVFVYSITPDGSIGFPIFINSSYSVRPVINLRADVTISSGDGSSTNPFVIET